MPDSIQDPLGVTATGGKGNDQIPAGLVLK
jgi:hypothetical protein